MCGFVTEGSVCISANQQLALFQESCHKFLLTLSYGKPLKKFTCIYIVIFRADVLVLLHWFALFVYMYVYIEFSKTVTQTSGLFYLSAFYVS